MGSVRSVYELVAVTALVACLVSVVASYTGAGRQLGAQAAALRGPLGLTNLVVGFLGLVLGDWLAAGGLLVGAVAFVPTAPVAVRRPSVARTSADIGVVTANVLVNNPRFAELVQGLLTDEPDVLLLQEVTPAHAATLRDIIAGHVDLHLLMEPRDDYAGWATVSRFPLTSYGRIDVPMWPITWTVVDHPVAPVRVVNVHAAAPQTVHDVATWERHFAVLADFVDRPIPTVLAGDFNATFDHRSFRRLLRAGFSDAFDVAGTGWGATWPVHRVVPPLLRLDHVLVGPTLVASSIESVDLPGSDHRGLRAHLSLAGTPTV